jgi:hypothetical protein
VPARTKPGDQASANAANFTKTLHVRAPPHRLDDAVATAAGARGWWSANPVATDGAIAVRVGGGTFRPPKPVDLAPDERAARAWLDRCFPVQGTTRTDGWGGPRVPFAIRANPAGSSPRAVTHIGLTPHLVCSGSCEPGWNCSPAGVKRHREEGTGAPYTGPV